MSLNLGDTKGTVFQVTPSEKYVKANVSTGRKDKRNDEWLNSNWRATFVGSCLEEAKKLVDKDKIKITSATCTNEPYTDSSGTKKYSVNLTIFEFEVIESIHKEELPF